MSRRRRRFRRIRGDGSPNSGSWAGGACAPRPGVVPLRPEDPLDRALELFVESDLLALPVIESDGEGRVIGIVKRADLSSTYLRYVQGVTASPDGATPAGM